MQTDIIKIDFSRSLGEQVRACAEILCRGGLVAFPTETVYGLGGNALDADAAKKIYAAKGRPSDNPLIIHIAKPEDAEKYCITNEAYYKIAEAFMPGPITVILPKKDNIPASVTGGLATVAVRCPANAVARALIAEAGVPVAAPSANTSGRPSPTAAEHVIDDLSGKIDAIIDGGEAEIGLESTIVLPREGGVTVLRPGGITCEMLAEVFESVTLDAGITKKNESGAAPLAPGMKYRHYAPVATVFLIKDAGNADFDGRVKKFLCGKLDREPRTGVICFDEYKEDIIGKNVFYFGKKADDEEHAKRLFDILRKFDKTDAPEIYATASDTRGVGLAIYNRMLKASGFNIIEI
ncbi:MAG: threonylcarbamoyl-AMP synthase [Clostridia bacterium]|nr:threonylcarbamoyl-AMP synthase [Clostridia bacterium]